MDGAETLGGWLRAQQSVLARVAADLPSRLRTGAGVHQDDTTLRMYVVGNAGVGKSTLLNALLNDRMAVLPHGGYGPYTARAARIRYAEDPYFAIEYRDRSHVEQLVARIDAGGAEAREAEREARLLVLGNQFGRAETAYLVECLREACHGRLARSAEEQDRGRLSVLADLLGSQVPRRHTRHAGTDLPAFLLDLETHGAGFLSALVEDIAIGWHAPLLKPGLELVDLPGVGVANDAYRDATRAALASAHAVLLVVDRAGITKDAAELLAPFLTSWAEDPRGASHLVVAVAKVDLVADDRRAGDSKTARRAWLDYFDEACTATVTLIRGQLRAELTRLLGPMPGRRMGTLLRRAKVRPVAPIEHQRFHRRDPEDPPRIRHEDDARVRALRETLEMVATAHRALVATVIDETLESAAADAETGVLALELRSQLARIMCD